MKMFLLTLATIALAGCEMGINGPNFPQMGMRCISYPNSVTLADTVDQVAVDSTSTCDDGGAPFVYRAVFLTTENSCDDISSPNQILGGLKGIQRTFGCRRKK